LRAVAQGLSHRQAGERFGVSAASVSRWRALERERGEARPRPLGGDRRSGRVEAHKDTILALIEETPDIVIEELRQALADKGATFGYGTIRRFFARHAITRKKRPNTPASRTAPTS
jgi:transposase